VERLVDELVQKRIEEAVQKELGHYLKINSTYRNPDLDIREKMTEIAQRQVAARFKNLPAQIDAVIEEFMKLVATAKLPTDTKRELHRELWSALVQVVVERFYGLLGKPAPESED
jgi:hypothetical protein